jgi:CubicO group peptidase (beta-lactamase class C family)
MMKRCVAAALALLACTLPAHAQPDPAATLEGVWQSRNAFGPELSGPLSITRDGVNWRATFGGATAESAAIDFSFGDDRGRFFGRLRRDRRTINGWWLQPPGLPGQAYATPLRLHAGEGGVWRGEVAPLPQRFTLFLRIARNEDSAWFAAFRNPEFNMNGGASRLRIGVSGGRVAFSNADGEIVRDADIVAPNTLRIAWPPLPMPVELTRTPIDPPQYLPRTRGAYVYAAPERTRDGWRAARARDVGMDESALTAFIQSVIDADPAARRPQLLHSVLVARRGRLVLEEYFHGYDRETPHDIRSAGKTFASVLLGALMHEGADIGPDTRIAAALSSRAPFANADPRKQDIALSHLLTHTSGLACNDNDEASPGSEGAMQQQSEQSDWHRFALDLPMAHEPGRRYAYCTAGVNLVGAALREASDESVLELIDRLIARPLGFGRYHWNLAPNGEAYLGGGAHVRPRDMLKLGQLYLNGGTWNGRRIVSRDWVASSTAVQAQIDEASTGMDEQTFANVALRGADGYAWHRYGVHAGGRRIETYEANGNGGQFVIVVPEYDLVVAITGGNYGQGGIWNRWRDEIVGAHIVAAIRE